MVFGNTHFFCNRLDNTIIGLMGNEHIYFLFINSRLFKCCHSCIFHMADSSFKHFGAFHMYVNTIRINGAVRHRFSHTAGWDI